MADKGIRPEAIRKFGELLPTRENTRLGNRNFRAAVNTHLMEQFQIPIHSAATAYNHAFLHYKEQAKTNPTLAAQLEGLGRPEDKKGGRKKKVAVAAPATTTPEVDGVAGDVLQSNILGNGGDDGGDETPPAPKVRVVQKNGKGTPQEFDSREDALAYIEANSGQFKPKLIIEGDE